MLRWQLASSRSQMSHRHFFWLVVAPKSWAACHTCIQGILEYKNWAPGVLFLLLVDSTSPTYRIHYIETQHAAVPDSLVPKPSFGDSPNLDQRPPLIRISTATHHLDLLATLIRAQKQLGPRIQVGQLPHIPTLSNQLPPLAGEIAGFGQMRTCLVVAVHIEGLRGSEPKRHKVKIARVRLGRPELPVLAGEVACVGDLEVAIGFLFAVVDDVERLLRPAERLEAVPGIGFERRDRHVKVGEWNLGGRGLSMRRWWCWMKEDVIEKMNKTPLYTHKTPAGVKLSRFSGSCWMQPKSRNESFSQPQVLRRSVCLGQSGVAVAHHWKNWVCCCSTLSQSQGRPVVVADLLHRLGAESQPPAGYASWRKLSQIVSGTKSKTQAATVIRVTRSQARFVFRGSPFLLLATLPLHWSKGHPSMSHIVQQKTRRPPSLVCGISVIAHVFLGHPATHLPLLALLYFKKFAVIKPWPVSR